MSPIDRQQLDRLAHRLLRRSVVERGRLVAVVISLPPAAGESYRTVLVRALERLGLGSLDLSFASLPGPPRVLSLEFER